MNLRNLRVRPQRVVALGVLIAVGFGVVAAWAAIPNSANGRITACYPKTGAKTLRVIDYQAGARCSGSEKMVSWPSDGMRYRGVWSAGANYAKGDVASFGGSSFVALTPSTGTPTTNTAVWVKMAAKGATGATGPAGTPAKPHLSPADIATGKWYPHLMNRIFTGEDPSDLVFDGTSVWVANYDSAGTGSVQRINPKTNAVVASITAVTNPAALAFDGTYIWVANAGANSVAKINRATNAVEGSPITVGTNPQGMLFDGESLWVSNLSSASVSRVNPSNGSVETYPVGSGPRGLAYDGDRIWVANSFAGSVTVLNGTTGALLATPTIGGTPQQVVYDGRYVWVSNGAGGTSASVFQPAVSLASFGSVTGPAASGIASDGRDIWVGNTADGGVLKVSGENGQVLRQVQFGGSPTDVVYDGSSIWVAVGGATNQVVRVYPG